MPPYVAKIRDVETEFEDFEHNFPKLEETVKTLQTRSTQTSDDIDTLRQQVGTLTQRQEAFTKLSLFVPALIALIIEMEGLLQEIVGGKRLSASKLTKFQEMVMKSLKLDTKIVTMLYRTHKSLPKNQKVSSLYVFDALARAAKHQASKHSLAIKEIPSDKPGNAGTFLFKLEGILDGLIEDMIKVGTPEAMEKTRKVLDIWKKANTFPADVLSRLLQSVDQGGQGTSGDGASISTPPVISEVPPTQTSESQTPATLNTISPAILALLGSALSTDGTTGNTIQPIVPTNVSAPPLPAATAAPPSNNTLLDSSQLALLQQLTQQIQGQGVPQTPTTNPYYAVPLFSNDSNSYTTGSVYNPNPDLTSARRYQEEREDPRRPKQTRDHYEAPSTSYGPRPPARDRYDLEDDYRRKRSGTGSSGRDREQRRWERPPLPSRRDQRSRSRSRSPPARGEPRIGSPAVRSRAIPTFTSESEALNPTTTIPYDSSRSTQSIQVTGSYSGQGGLVVVGQDDALGQNGETSSPAEDLDSFDLTGFDMTSAASWMRLGAAFKVSRGRDGSQEELVSTYMALQSGFPPPTFGNGGPSLPPNDAVSMMQNQRKVPGQDMSYGNAQSAYWSTPANRINTWETREQDEMRRGGRHVGHGSYDDGIGYAAQSGRWQQSDAVVLTGGDDS
ncbi:hypothetical protein FRC16_006764 [Serendipita sp. 398]|nr:hypothetical protein FRC16_006764 [Serendipita sp. 398]